MTKKITQLTELTNAVGADLLEIVDDVGGTPASKKITLENLLSSSANQAPTGAIDLSSASSISFPTGTWTPTIYGVTTAGSPTGTFGGTYVDYGEEAVLRGRVLLTSKGGMSGVIRVGGFPFTTIANSDARATVTFGLTDGYTFSASEFLTADVVNSSTEMRLNISDNTGLAANVTDADISDTFTIYFEIRMRKA